MKAFLILEDGTVFEGMQIGADKEVISEIVFNTSMAGYLEVLTDPSYAGQAVCMTYPLIGNYGICKDDMESSKPYPDGFIVRELSRNFSNFRADVSIQQFLEENSIPGIAGIDTRALVKILREKGTMNGMITANEAFDLDDVLPKLKAYTTGKVVEQVTCPEKYEVKGARCLSENGALSGSAKFSAADYEAGKREKKPSLVTKLNGAGLKVALLDFGTKKNIACSLAQRGCDVTVYPAATPAAEIIASNPDGIMLSNGPGDPADNIASINTLKELIPAKIPTFGICLGHQLLALANGAKTEKLKYGHRGGNQPVKDLALDKTFITSQNHGYAVIGDSVPENAGKVSHINGNDGTCEGVRYTNAPAFTVQFHPEACGGPHDTSYLFDEFIKLMGRN